jgi:hypothetical protein
MRQTGLVATVVALALAVGFQGRSGGGARSEEAGGEEIGAATLPCDR